MSAPPSADDSSAMDANVGVAARASQRVAACTVIADEDGADDDEADEDEALLAGFDGLAMVFHSVLIAGTSVHRRAAARRDVHQTRSARRASNAFRPIRVTIAHLLRAL
ncbi:hypothetical protein OSJ77_15890 [Phyllobacterium sp. 0TCS1.6C]|uniref:hypothetical protein n=1 Tax=unclassified Phyllobacterium TaxID=2638441 RepID=UPI002264D991|nr:MULTISPECIES: hypothetical protein [unclassified Phyllobacterium]MCX8281675.1 hypothetical protein [Phyllobacterium sp. 0TCS1.6C]MCX8294785.1 hypothetical protein [Phyllobacterium sp. 0TCS1.6A]